MLSAQELRQALRSKPFHPFRIVFHDGATRDVRHPDMVRLTETAAYIFMPPAAGPIGPDTLFSGMEIIGLDFIARLTDVPAVASA